MGAVVILAAAAAYNLRPSQPAAIPAFEIASSTEEVSKTPLEVIEEAVTSAVSPDPVKESKGPAIATTPFSVYIGKATAFGTSSPTLMGQEVSQVVVGYEWESLASSPMFDSVSLPQWDPADTGAQKYQVYIWNEEENSYRLLGAYPVGQEIQFPRDDLNGPRRFKVLGINPALLVCPGDRSFVWSFRLTYPGSMSIVRTPITEPLPVSQTCEMR